MEAAEESYFEISSVENRIREECLEFFKYRNSLENKNPDKTDPDMGVSVATIGLKGILYFRDQVTNEVNYQKGQEDATAIELVNSIRFGALVGHLSERKLIPDHELPIDEYLDDAKKAKDDLASLFKDVVYSNAYDIVSHYPNAEVDDLIQEGYMGMLKSIWLFDSSRGSFKNYANTRIKGSIVDWLRENYSIIRIPRSIKRDIGEIEKCKQAGEFRPKAIAEELGISTNRVKLAESCARFSIDYLSQGTCKDGNPITTDGCAVIARDNSAEAAIKEIDFKHKLTDVLGRVHFADDRQKKMFYQKLGIADYLSGAPDNEEVTYAQMQGEYGVGWTRICQIVGEAKRKFLEVYDNGDT